jgi:2,3-bisphosphoglycerate-dependent phosphoglycerate mutase
VPDLVLLRHGQSEWNALNLFTGWHDVDLSEAGRDEAAEAGELLRSVEGLDLRVLHTSVLTRAIHTAEIALRVAGRSWLPVKREWRLNERHYGDLTGKDKKETAARYGAEQVHQWRRSFDVPPPALPEGDERRVDADPRYRDVPAAQIPATECLKDVVERVRPYLEATLAPELRREGERGGAVIVVAHGNSLRALRLILESIGPDEIVDLEIPTGIPFRYRLDAEHLRVLDKGYLGDADMAARAADEVRRQAG